MIACLIYIVPLRKRFHGFKLYIIIALTALLIYLMHYIGGQLHIVFWIPNMILSMFIMFSLIYTCCEIAIIDAVCYFCRAFIAAEFVASLQWQIYYILIEKGLSKNYIISFLLMAFFYTLTFSIIYSVDVKKHSLINYNARELLATLSITAATFLISNSNFIISDSLFGSFAGTGILYIRTLVDFSGMTILFSQQEIRREMQLKYEVESLNNILHRQYEQYQQSKESIDLISIKYHDLKHQINIIKSEQNAEMKELYLEEMEHSINVFESQNKTGNYILDTVLTSKNLYCKDNDIDFIFVAEGQLLNFMQSIDICSIFGNALDNAIETVEKIVDKEKRIIRGFVFRKNEFIMIRIENYYIKNIIFENNLPITTKKDTSYHGYGIKSIKQTAEKYGGTVTINTQNNWFVICILLPSTKNNKTI